LPTPTDTPPPTPTEEAAEIVPIDAVQEAAYANGEGQEPTPLAAPTIQPLGEIDSAALSGETTAGGVMQFSALSWQGGHPQDNGWCGRAWTGVYGAASNMSQSSLVFTLEQLPANGATLTITGLDDENEGGAVIDISVNSASLWNGPSPFESMPNEPQCTADAPWRAWTTRIAAELLTVGENVVTVTNVEGWGEFGLPPYVLLSDATLSFE
jgi:hypothetical protein